MLKTNSKKARENIRAYIVDCYNPENYDLPACNDFPTIAQNILRILREEKRGPVTPDLFEDWAAGLPSVLDTCYYYNRSAVDDLGAILEETEEEKSRYTEQQAESLLTRLIYREIIKA